ICMYVNCMYLYVCELYISLSLSLTYLSLSLSPLSLSLQRVSIRSLALVWAILAPLGFPLPLEDVSPLLVHTCEFLLSSCLFFSLFRFCLSLSFFCLSFSRCFGVFLSVFLCLFSFTYMHLNTYIHTSTYGSIYRSYMYTTAIGLQNVADEGAAPRIFRSDY